MKEIGYRAWIEAKKKMVDVCALDFEREMVLYKEYGDFKNVELMQFTGFSDDNGSPIYEGDIVKMFDDVYEVVFECGAFGLARNKTIDWDKLDEKILEYTGCDNSPSFCYNDNFISLWEIYWNYNEEEEHIDCIEVISNIYENEELLE